VARGRKTAAGGSAGTGATGTGGKTGTGGALGIGGNSGSGGGFSGSGGTAGTPDAARPPVTIGKCDNLPAAGTWENVSPQEALAPWVKPVGPATSGVDMVVVHPTLSGTIFIDWRDRGLHRSEDCGATWKHVNTGTNGALLDGGGLFILINPTTPSIFYAWGNYGAGGLWKSTNEGVDWTQTFTGNAADIFQYGFISAVAMDPTNPDHLVASPHGTCTGAFATCMVETHDGGTTWRIFQAPAWVETSGVVIVSEKIWLYATGLNGMFRTVDAGATWTSVAGIGGTYPQSYRSSSGRYFIPSGQGVIASTDDAATAWTTLGAKSLVVHLAGSDTMLYACNQWSGYCEKGPPDDGTAWTAFASPSELPLGYGSSNLAYDQGHHILYYTSTDSSYPGFQGGVWRIVTP
jgi:hypothetical protein